jgi:hypothetical protein
MYVYGIKTYYETKWQERKVDITNIILHETCGTSREAHVRSKSRLALSTAISKVEAKTGTKIHFLPPYFFLFFHRRT